MPQPGSPTSLISPEAAAGDDRRCIANYDATVDMAVPTDPPLITTKLEGWNTRGARWLHYLVELLEAGSGCDFELWLFNDNARRWYLDTRLGTDGLVTIATTDADYPKNAGIIEIAGASRAYIRLLTETGTWTGGATDGANVWLSGTR
jgi:hypothetical protein